MLKEYCTCSIQKWLHLNSNPMCLVLKMSLLAKGQWHSPVSSSNKTDHHDITEILLKVALNTINQPNNQNEF